MRDKLLDFSKLCVDGMSLMDGQQVAGLDTYVSYGVYIHEKLDLEKMEAAVNRLYHEIDTFRLRLRREKEGKFYEYVDATEYKISVLDAKGETLEEKKAYVQEYVLKRTHQIQNRELESPLVVEFFRLEEEEYFTAVYLDHYISDGHSIGVTLMKMMSYYTGSEIPGSISQGNIHNYIAYQNSDELENRASLAADYWKEELKDYTISGYRIDENQEKCFEESPVCIKYDKSEFVDFAKRNRCTLGNLITGIYHLALAGTFGSMDNVISYVSTDRNSVEHWGLIGPFLKPLNHRVKLNPELTVKQYLKQISGISGKNLIHKDAHICDIGLNRYGLTYMNHSKLFLTDPRFTQWMPEMRMDCIKNSFILLRVQELENTVETDFICNPEYFNRSDYLKFIEKYDACMKKIRSSLPDDKLEQFLL